MLDEYLQAALISVEKDRIDISMRLTPGVAVFPQVFASIDLNADQTLSAAEKQSYAERFLSDVSLTVDGKRQQLRLLSVDFPPPEQMREGLGEIHIELSANTPAGHASRKLIFENHHQSVISAYLMNCLVPRDSDIHVLAQNRSRDQSVYQLNLAEPGIGSPSDVQLGTRQQ